MSHLQFVVHPCVLVIPKPKLIGTWSLDWVRWLIQWPICFAEGIDVDWLPADLLKLWAIKVCMRCLLSAFIIWTDNCSLSFSLRVRWSLIMSHEVLDLLLLQLHVTLWLAENHGWLAIIKLWPVKVFVWQLKRTLTYPDGCSTWINTTSFLDHILFPELRLHRSNRKLLNPLIFWFVVYLIYQLLLLINDSFQVVYFMLFLSLGVFHGFDFV